MSCEVFMSADFLSSPLVRLSLLAQGQVQGVGFRPFIYRLATELSLTGSVGNTSEGVRIEVQGTRDTVARFPVRLREELPPLARLTDLRLEHMPPVQDETTFRIIMSHGQHGHTVLISPDVGLCPDCAADMHDPANARFAYPFTNCTSCGPRYTITRSIPYDRAVTSMACFPMCPSCAKEYTDPLNRRFHAQPIACPVCGPQLWFVERKDVLAGRTAPAEANRHLALQRACDALTDGQIVALRGLGGFQLACDARSGTAVAALRQRKHRPHKSFALMVKDLETVRSLCRLSPAEEDVLTSPARPAVILARLPHVLPESVAPDLATLAVMLPTTPLHVALFDLLASRASALTRPAPVLIMTSGNDAGDPICLGNREALRRLAGIADSFLLHDRDILCRVDDSVVACDAESTNLFFFRRARGYVPSPLPLGTESGPCVLGAGADLKATCCLTRASDAFVGQHTGDLEHPATAAFYDETIRHLASLLEVRPELVVRDCHPDFYSSRRAEEIAADLKVPCVQLQHHAAHAAAVFAEYQVSSQSLALVLDGYGYGLDGTVWGGEVVRMDLGQARWSRAGHLAPFALPGGDAATRAPWRLALSLAGQIRDQKLAAELFARWERRRGREAAFVHQMLDRHLNTPLCSSCGRLFDAVSAQLGLGETITYEGQAAIVLETAARRADPAALSDRMMAPGVDTLVLVRDHTVLLDSAALFARVARLQRAGMPVPAIALDFHQQLALGLTELVTRLRGPMDSESVGLAGGVLNNMLLRGLLTRALRARGLRPLVPSAVPAGDGGLSLGQAAWGLALIRTHAPCAATCQSRR